MKKVWPLALLALVGCSDKQAGSGAQDQKATAASAKQAGSPAQDPKTAAALASKDEQCPGGTVKGCFDAASESERKGDFTRAVELYSRACDAGVARACTMLGALVWQGRGVEGDPARAFALYMRACDGGDMAGCFSAGVCHRTGACAEKNEAVANTLIQRACDGGDARACANLGGK